MPFSLYVSDTEVLTEGGGFTARARSSQAGLGPGQEQSRC